MYTISGLERGSEMKFTVLIFVTMNACALALISFSSTAQAANDPVAIQKSANADSTFQCMDLRKASQKLPVYAGNIANRDTTRTPGGGPYKRIELICKQTYCEQVAKEDYKFVYLPAHPDANSTGMVRMPIINVGSEYAAVTSAAAEVRLLANSGACGASSLSSASMAMIKYDLGTSVQSDVFNYATDGHLSSWSRTLRDGTSQHVSFNADGTTSAQ